VLLDERTLERMELAVARQALARRHTTPVRLQREHGAALYRPLVQ
jgi:hypothetical protein